MLRILAALLLVALSAAASGAEPYEVTIERGLAPRMAPDRVAELALERLRGGASPSGRAADEGKATPPSVRGIRCIRGADVERVIPTRTPWSVIEARPAI